MLAQANRLWKLSRYASAALMLTSSLAFASGGDDFIESVFAPDFHIADQEIRQYASGNVGIVSGSYWRIFHVLAYRAVSGVPLSKEEQDLFAIARWNVAPGKLGPAAIPSPAPPPPPTGTKAELDPIETWVEARKLAGGTNEVKLDYMAEAGEFDYFLNCPQDAFDRAAKTLNERLKSGGKQWATVWRTQQDAVFANCNSTFDKVKKKRPYFALPPLPANAPNWLKLDYEYQSAAALFYSEQFEAARAKFQAIAKTPDSPWRTFSGYLATRCLIRHATLHFTQPDGKENTKRDALLETARSELLALGKIYPPAQQLLGWVDAKLRPNLRMTEIAQQINSKNKDGLVQLLIDYIVLMDKIPPTDRLNSSEAMSAWIAAMQANARLGSYDSEDKNTLRKQALQVSRKFWARKRESWWLMPLLANAKVGELSSDEIKAANSVASTNPAYHTLQFHLARLAIAEHKLDQADDIVNTALASGNLPTSSRNRWLRVKLASAKTLEDFLQAGKREKVEKMPDYSGLSEKEKETNTEYKRQMSVNSESDIVRHLLQHMPLAQLKQVQKKIQDIHFPTWYGWRDSITPDLNVAIWTRAVLAGDYASADEVTDQVMAGREKGGITTKHLYQRFKDAKDANAKRYAAMLIFINAPELQPFTISPEGNGLYWGCTVNWTTEQMLEADQSMPNFLSKEARQVVEKEQKKLLTLPIRSEYLAPILFEYAKANPSDPEVPKALHFFVASTRLECSSGPYVKRDEKLKPQYSKQAFQLLHKNYGKTEWAAKTKYFF